MPRYRRLAFLITGLLTIAPLANSAQNATALHPGDPFPQLTAQTLTSKSLDLPSAASGKPAVFVFSFTRTAGKDARLWNQQLSKDFSTDAPDYDVIVLESVPKLFRGMALSGIRSSMPLALQDRTIILYQDEALWKTRLAVSNDNRAYLILLGPDGQIRSSNTGKYTESAYAQFKNEVEKALQPNR
jgi:ATP10 protein